MARPIKCTPDVIETYQEQVTLGVSLEVAAALAGVSYQATVNWRERGKAELERREGNVKEGTRQWNKEQPFVEFFEAHEHGLAKCQQLLIGRIQQASQGGREWTETKVTYKTIILKDKDGNEVPHRVLDREEVTTKREKPNWNAASWLAERRFPDDFGRRTRVDHANADDKPLKTEMSGSLGFTNLTDEELNADIERLAGRYAPAAEGAAFSSPFGSGEAEADGG